VTRIAIVASALANKPLNGGFAWVPLSYVLGLQRLGFDAYLLEQGSAHADRSFFRDVAGAFGLERHSELLPDGDESFIREVARDAELLVNISGHATLEWVVAGPRLSAYIDTDPGFTQLWNRAGLLSPTIWGHSHHFSVGLNLGLESCLVPNDGIDWRPLPPPVVLDQWPVAGERSSDVRFTTVATWRSPSGVVSLDGTTYLPSKLHEFRRMLPLPSLMTGATFEIALDIHPADGADRQNLLRNGWILTDPGTVACDPHSFRAYVGGSAAEFSPAQGVYYAANTGWISDRSVRYLASGRPVLVQETGVAKDIACAEGFLTFRTLEQAQRGAERIAADYDAHSKAARQLAETYFDSDRVLGDMLDRMGARA
jgi:hypothetical protein